MIKRKVLDNAIVVFGMFVIALVLDQSQAVMADTNESSLLAGIEFLSDEEAKEYKGGGCDPDDCVNKIIVGACHGSYFIENRVGICKQGSQEWCPGDYNSGWFGRRVDATNLSCNPAWITNCVAPNTDPGPHYWSFPTYTASTVGSTWNGWYECAN